MTTVPTHAFTAHGAKSMDATELVSGDIAFKGYAVVWDGLDAEGENFIRGAVRDAIPAFLAGSAPVAFHHDRSKVLGRILDMYEDRKGVFVRGRVDRQEPSSPLWYVYNAVRRGSVRGLSLSGYFQRQPTPAGRMISKVLRIVEVSLTPAAQHPQTGVCALEVKALPQSQRARELDALRRVETELGLLKLRLSAVDALQRISAARGV